MVGAMTAAANTPHCHLFDDVTVDELLRVRAALQGSPSLDGKRLTLLPLLIKVGSETEHTSVCVCVCALARARARQ